MKKMKSFEEGPRQDRLQGFYSQHFIFFNLLMGLVSLSNAFHQDGKACQEQTLYHNGPMGLFASFEENVVF
jgi:hypothetical protein